MKRKKIIIIIEKQTKSLINKIITKAQKNRRIV